MNETLGFKLKSHANNEIVQHPDFGFDKDQTVYFALVRNRAIFLSLLRDIIFLHIISDPRALVWEIINVL